MTPFIWRLRELAELPLAAVGCVVLLVGACSGRLVVALDGTVRWRSKK